MFCLFINSFILTIYDCGITNQPKDGYGEKCKHNNELKMRKKGAGSDMCTATSSSTLSLGLCSDVDCIDNDSQSNLSLNRCFFLLAFHVHTINEIKVFKSSFSLCKCIICSTHSYPIQFKNLYHHQNQFTTKS
jgi:hypothetical protein